MVFLIYKRSDENTHKSTTSIHAQNL